MKKYKPIKIVAGLDVKTYNSRMTMIMSNFKKLITEKVGECPQLSREELIYQFASLLGGNPPSSQNKEACKSWLYDRYLKGQLGQIALPKQKEVKKRLTPKQIKNIYKIRDENGVYGIYKITCVENQRFYIGSSSNVSARFITHKHALSMKTHANSRLQADYNSFGEKAFLFELVWKASGKISELSLLEKEQHYIDTLDPYYNIERRVVPDHLRKSTFVDCSGNSIKPLTKKKEKPEKEKLSKKDKQRIQRALEKLNAPPKPISMRKFRKRRHTRFRSKK